MPSRTLTESETAALLESDSQMTLPPPRELDAEGRIIITYPPYPEFPAVPASDTPRNPTEMTAPEGAQPFMPPAELNEMVKARSESSSRKGFQD